MIPKGCDWLQTKVETFHPETNTVVTSDGDKVWYADNQEGHFPPSLLSSSEIQSFLHLCQLLVKHVVKSFQISYEYLIVALGLELRFDMVRV